MSAALTAWADDNAIVFAGIRAYRTRGTSWRHSRPEWQWVVAVDVPSLTCLGTPLESLCGPAVVDDFGTLVAVEGLQ